MDVSIITINYNTSASTINLLESVLKFTSSKLIYEIIVVDNNSNITDYQNLTEKAPRDPRIRIIRSRINYGFGGGNVYGVQHARGTYYLFLNNDTELLEDSISTMFNEMNLQKEVGVMGPRCIKSNGYYIHGFGHFYNLQQSILGVRLYEKYTHRKNPWIDYSQPIEVDFIMGACMFFRATAFNEAGGFDTNIFLYYEEMDICYRLSQNGFKALYYPLTTIQHHEGQSSHSNHKTITIRKEQQISQNYFLRKTTPLWKYLLWFFITAIKFPIRVLRSKDINYPLFLLHLKGNSLKFSLKQQQKLTKE